MKKALAILLSVLLLVGTLTGCGASSGSSNSTDSSGTGSSAGSSGSQSAAPSGSTGDTTVAMSGTADRPDLDATVLVYGNANNDAYVAEDDVAFLEAIVGGEAAWDKEANPMADADCDGEITQSDIDLVKKIINKETCEVFIKNYYGEVQKMHFPLTDKRICVTYAQCRDAIAILGRWDGVVVVNESVPDRSPANIDFSQYGHIGTTGSSAVGDTEVEVMLSYDVDFIVAIPRTDGTKEVLEKFVASRENTDLFYCMYGEYAVSSILTLGVLMDASENALKYVQYRDAVKTKLKRSRRDREVQNGKHKNRSFDLPKNRIDLHRRRVLQNFPRTRKSV